MVRSSKLFYTTATALVFAVAPLKSAAFLTSSRQYLRSPSAWGLRAGENLPPVDKDVCAVLFDFDGTLGNTEQPAMEVAFWELAPYFPGVDSGTLPDEQEFVRTNAGKAFEFMVENVEEERKAAGLPSIEEARANGMENPDILKLVDKRRADFGLKPFLQVKEENGGKLPDLLLQQKSETVDALSVVSRPCPGVPEMLEGLKKAQIRFAIATTSPKPRVPASVVACELMDSFPEDKIHSGESDFDPPRFKPDPSVYLKAAQHEGVLIENSIAVEDSASGVGSASNAGVGLLVGYVGAEHIIDSLKDGHAKSLIAGEKATNGRGADLVISHMDDLLPIVLKYSDIFMDEGCVVRDVFGKSFCDEKLKGKVWLP